MINYFVIPFFIELCLILSASASEVHTIQNGDFGSLRNPFDNQGWDKEVKEVLNLLGINEEIDYQHQNYKMSKRLHTFDMSNTGYSGHKKSGFKWQYTVIASVCSVAAVFGTVLAATCYYKMSRASGTGPLAGSRSSSSSNNGSGIVALGGNSAGDKKLAQSAQMYHYQHQKQQMIALEKADVGYRNEGSDDESEPDDALDDYTVYECPGMAIGGELEVKNPLFQTDPPSPPGGSAASKNGTSTTGANEQGK